ncbi:partner and localizer of BRCA2 [Parambassis ranga]|uniref:Partner and localizer of BRCA2 n=1 Tax=Parambassis ranga TaxID=210632 RepID=A0A6P7KF93_9TELE|nr:partner and localizer of BRCA2 [Parambassis ranga]
METNVEDVLHCEEQLKTTLYCDDKDKLRRRLAQLQKEYLRTAQRLQRAERLDAVRRHVKSRISQTLHQRDPEVTSGPCLNPSSLIQNTSNRPAVDLPQCQGQTEGPADSRRSQMVRFLLPADAECPRTPDPSHDTPSPVLRLRSRRSRLRWEKRSAEAGKSTEVEEKGQNQSVGIKSTETAGKEEKAKSEETDPNESEELFSGTESESPSLLLSHWNTPGTTQTGDTEEKEYSGHQEQGEKETTERKKESDSTSLLLTCSKPTLNIAEKGQSGSQTGRRKEVKRAEDGGNSRETKLSEENSNKETELIAAEKTERDDFIGEKEEKNGDEKMVNLLDSCTLVEGLLFPAEYYVRTTRRMTLSQSQPDMQAVIQSQLSTGRRRRSRGQGRGLNKSTSENSGQIDLSSLSTPSMSIDPHKLSLTNLADACNEHCQRPSQGSDPITETLFSPTVTPTRLARGRRSKRGRGRGRPQTPRPSPSLDLKEQCCEQTDDPQPTSTPVSSSVSVHEVDEQKPCCVSMPDAPQPVTTDSDTSQPSSGVNEAPFSPASGHQERVYPIFLKSNVRTNRSPRINTATSSWSSLLLPSSPLDQTSLLHLPSLFPGQLFSSLKLVDIHQDFHLPDDQFASLKLHKLRQVTVESGVEHLPSPSFKTHSSNKQTDQYSSSEPLVHIPLPLSLTPTVTDSAPPNVEQQEATQSQDIQRASTEHRFTDKLIRETSTEELPDQAITKTHGEQQTENLHAVTCSAESVSVVQECPDDCIDKYEKENCHSQSNVTPCRTPSSINHPDKPQPHLNLTDQPADKVNNSVKENAGELQITQLDSKKDVKNCCEVPPLEDQRTLNPKAEDTAIIQSLSSDCPVQETPEELSKICSALQACDDMKASGESLNRKASKEPTEPDTNLSADRLMENENKCLPHHSLSSQLLLGSSLGSVPCPFVTPHLSSSTLTSSPTLPSVGLTPHPITSFVLTSSPSAPSLTLPPPHSPSTQALSPPALSPCPSISSLPPSLPPLSPCSQIEALSEPPGTGDEHCRLEPSACPTPPGIQNSGGRESQKTVEPAGEHTVKVIHTLKAPAGGLLVDMCCLLGSSGDLCVAAAGKWAVCLWNQTAASDWSLTHTWTFTEPVINVFPVPDAAGLMCVTLGQLEIREVRILSCSSLMQMSVCEGIVQAVVCMSKSRVVTSSHSAKGSTLQVFMLSDSSSSPSSQLLECPGVCIGTLAPVDGLSDALIGMDESGHLFIWNLKTGQLLHRVLLGEDLSCTVCLRGYSFCGVLFVLLQHHFLSSLTEEVKDAKLKIQMCSEEELKAVLFSLVAINPVSGKWHLATRLYPPKAWTGRLCEADVNQCSVVGLSQSGCLCVWELGQQAATQMVEAPDSEGWQLARWGAGDTLVLGHHNGDVTLHFQMTF